jgi:hypothetical protein
MGQGWAELQARQVLDAAFSSAAPVAAPARARPVMPYAAPAKRAARASGGSSHHARNMLIGGAICAVGIAITAGTYSAASGSGGSYTICWGAIVFGFIRFISGFAGWMSGG